MDSPAAEIRRNEIRTLLFPGKEITVVTVEVVVKNEVVAPMGGGEKKNRCSPAVTALKNQRGTLCRIKKREKVINYVGTNNATTTVSPAATVVEAEVTVLRIIMAAVE